MRIEHKVLAIRIEAVVAFVPEAEKLESPICHTEETPKLRSWNAYIN